MQISIEEAVAHWESFDTIIDVRSPAEWQADHLPGAINCPALSNDERSEIGTLYKASSFEAKKRGAALVAKNIAQALETTFLDRPRNWRPLVYCWRGGNRSNSFATVMHRIGWKVSVLTGGYTAYRRFMVLDLAARATALRYRVICGVTGSGKSAYLRALAAQGRQVLDLEALAHHRGSLLGSEPVGEQPSQKYFETQIWNVLRGFDPAQDVYVESESKKIGALQVPDALIEQMRSSPCVELAPTLADRVRFLCHDYQHFFDQPEKLLEQLNKLKPLVGGTRLDAWAAMIQARQWPDLVESLLLHHYDPTYANSMRKNYQHYLSAEQISGHPGL